MLVCFATWAHSASKTVLVLGDSLSAEYGLARESGWVALLNNRLQEANIDAKVINASISGETTSGGKSRLQTLLAKHRPDIVLIELGGNDGLRGLSLAATKTNLKDMILQSHDAKAKVLLAEMQIPPNYGREYAERFSAMYRTLAREYQATLIPFFLQGVADRAELMQDDRIHPNGKAQPVLLANVWSYLKPLLTK